MNEGMATLLFITGVALGLSFGWGWGGYQLQGETRDEYIHWTEDCYPNKPSWVDPKGTCWVDGQRVIVNSERRE